MSTGSRFDSDNESTDDFEAQNGSEIIDSSSPIHCHGRRNIRLRKWYQHDMRIKGGFNLCECCEQKGRRCFDLKLSAVQHGQEKAGWRDIPTQF
ncbi:hypothetical protein ETB97_007636 [Aspergillus alliaceus]|uniref:Uncharacterized protein n=1 Tax=Petromyces alliaceus TaxID=209559 RepID=A0A8H5ZXV0_PETAA|nr:hypothetical protein ETB97_007636 [Aspergillus burnettii]